MSEFKWCHGPSCHKSHTQDRIRGSKGSKVLRTRKIRYNPNYPLNFDNYFCSTGCYNDFAHKHVEQVIRIAPRTEPLETPIEDPKREKHETGYGHAYYNTTIKERVDNDSNVG